MSRIAHSAIASPENEVFVSVASLWEISIKVALGKLQLSLQPIDAFLDASGFEGLTILPRHAIAAGALPRHQNDPFDRMLIAQARIETLTLVTADAAFAKYDVALLAGS